MTRDEALKALEELVRTVTGRKDVALTPTSDLKADGILDSADLLVFFMELDSALGLGVPEDADLQMDGWYSVARLLAELEKK